MSGRTREQLDRRNAEKREARRIAREARGFASIETMRKFMAEQAAKTRSARFAVIQPSVAKRQAMQAASIRGATSAEFEANGGVVEVLPTYWDSRPGPAPARHYPKAGLL